MNIDKVSSNFVQLPFMKRRETPQPGKNELRVPLFGFLPNKIRNHFIAMVGEFIGTFMFLFFAFAGTQVANAGISAATAGDQPHVGGKISQVPNNSGLLYIALAFGFSLAVNAWVFFRISGGLFNPAVALALALVGAITWVRAGLVFIAEMLGAICSAAVVSALFPGPLNVTTTRNNTTSLARGVFIEMFLTAELIFTILMLAAEKHKGTFLAPVGIGLALFVAELAGVYFTGGSLNPARSFGPCVANAQFPPDHWIYWVGPALGALIAVGFYRFVKLLEYETANPGADFNEKEAEVFEFDEDNAATSADVVRPNVALQPTPSDVRSASRGTDQIPGEGGRVTSSKTSSDAYTNGPIAEEGGLTHPVAQNPPQIPTPANITQVPRT